MSQRFEGKNLEEALTHAAQTLGVERWQMTYSVLLEKRGFLGGVKRIVIDAAINEAATAPAPAAQPAPVAPSPSAPPRSPERSSRGPRGGGGSGGGGRGARSGGGGGGRGGRDRGGRGGGGGGGRRRDFRDDEKPLQPGDFEEQFSPEEVPEQGAESENAKAVREWCEELVDLSRLDLDLRTEENETQIIVRLYGRDASRVIDRHGELLDAIQVLANKALVGRRLEKDVELDCRQFKERRVEEIEKQALEIADLVRRDGREQLLPAMSPVERRIVHIALREDADVATESRGDGFFKRVAIIPKPAEQQTDVDREQA